MQSLPDGLDYGGACTLAGNVVATFGFDPLEVDLAFLYSLRRHSEQSWLPEEEQQSFDRASSEPCSAEAQLAAA